MERKGKENKGSVFIFFHPVRLKLFFVILQILNMVWETNMKLIGGDDRLEGNGDGAKQE